MCISAVVVFGNQAIHIHKVIVASACGVLATRWEPLGACLNYRTVLDVHCEPTGMNTSCMGAIMFFE